MSGESLAIIRAVVGLAQGAALYLLYNATEAKVWPATDGQIFGPLLLTTVFVPVLAVAGLGNLRLRTLAIWAAAATVAVAALGAYEGFHDPTGGVYGRGSSSGPSLPLSLAVAMGLAITHALVGAGDADRAWIAKYPRYFDVAWKHAVQLALAGAFIGALWALLFLGAGLFHLINIPFFEKLIQKPWFAIPVTTLALAVAIHITDVQAHIVRGVRTLALTLLSWLLPLFALIAIGFLATLAFTGLEPLWSTRYATNLVLVTAAALIVLINAAYQDGEHPVAFVLRPAGIGAALALTSLVAIAAYAVMLRVNQYGWTPERVIAATCVLVAACYALGYALAVLTVRSWLKRIEMANVVTSVVVVAAILALFSPVADPVRISVADQVARLEAGQIPVEKFDFTFLRFHSGRYGMAALERLRDKTEGPDAARIAEKAVTALAAKTEYGSGGNNVLAPPTPEDRAANIAVAYPKGQPLPAAFLKQEWNATRDRWRHPLCLTQHLKCDAVVIDLDGDGAAEVLLFEPTHPLFAVYKETGGEWIRLGDLQNSTCTGVREALLAGKFELATPEIKEVSMAGARLQIIVDRRCP